jgi:hypothetical protein
MYDRLGEVERQHNNAYEKNPHGVTLHPRDTEWLIERAKKAERYEIAMKFAVEYLQASDIKQIQMVTKRLEKELNS